MVNHKKQSFKDLSKSMMNNSKNQKSNIEKIKNNFLAYIDSTEVARKNSEQKEIERNIKEKENWAQILVNKEMEFEAVVQKLNIKTFLVK